jgi:hypothetical protein
MLIRIAGFSLPHSSAAPACAFFLQRANHFLSLRRIAKTAPALD